MSQLSKVLRDAVDSNGVKYLNFKCPGCNKVHSVTVSGNHAWKWNDDIDKPTFSPSVLVIFPAKPEAKEEFKEWRTERRCHSFVTDGCIQFLSDCTHELAGQTVSLPEWED
jgi:phage FluMu protein Com